MAKANVEGNAKTEAKENMAKKANAECGWNRRSKRTPLGTLKPNAEDNVAT